MEVTAKWVVLGQNSSGKTTLSKKIMDCFQDQNKCGEYQEIIEKELIRRIICLRKPNYHKEMTISLIDISMLPHSRNNYEKNYYLLFDNSKN